MKTWKEISKDFIELHTIEDMDRAGQKLKQILEEMIPQKATEVRYAGASDEERYAYNKCRQEMLDKIKDFFKE